MSKCMACGHLAKRGSVMCSWHALFLPKNLECEQCRFIEGCKARVLSGKTAACETITDDDLRRESVGTKGLLELHNNNTVHEGILTNEAQDANRDYNFDDSMDDDRVWGPDDNGDVDANSQHRPDIASLGHIRRRAELSIYRDRSKRNA